MNSASFLSARLPNSETLLNLSEKLSHLPVSAQADISQTMFNDFPSTTHVIEHDIDVGSHAPVKQNAYRVNSVKSELMKQETRYLLEHNLAVPSASPWCSPCLLALSQMGPPGFVLTTIKLMH